MSGELFPRERRTITPGAVHLPDWLGPDRQRVLLEACRAWARPPAGLRTVRLRRGTMSVRQVCLGWHWSPVPRCPRCGQAVVRPPDTCDRHFYPYALSRTVVDGDGAPVTPFPDWLGDWAREAVAAARYAAAVTPPDQRLPPYDMALVNHYAAGARMGMHQDAEERSDAPVVSFSLGDSCVFRFGTSPGHPRPWTDVELRAGDAFVFGGAARRAHHGVPRTHPGTAPAQPPLEGRVNVTIRVSGLE